MTSHSQAAPAFAGRVRIAGTRNKTHDGKQLIALVWRLVRDEGFDPEDFMIMGSGRLVVAGLRNRMSDIDLVARESTWQRAKELVQLGRGYVEYAPFSGAPVIRLYEGLVEVFDHWFMEGAETDALIESAEVLDGLRYMRLEDLEAYKRQLDRPKDRRDLAVLSRIHQTNALRGLANPENGRTLRRSRISQTSRRMQCRQN